ncbi:MAG: hypothetical protein M1812_002886 [Candelaria pacifica]|nr:MAG: hypothetical protein M1812_002886 [Candelaria pacifica]
MSMQTQTPRRLNRPRPSLGNSYTASSPNLAASYSQKKPLNAQSAGVTASAAQARKASLHQLTSNSLSTIPDGSSGYGLEPQASPSSDVMTPTTPATKRLASGDDGIELAVGDAVDVPGGMHGSVKFIGSVKGKSGVFAGVELGREWAARGKNDGDVDGVRYFKTSMPGAGIFLPLGRATKRPSPSSSASFSLTPTTPSVGGFNLNAPRGDSYMNAHTPPTPAMHKFSQSVGPGRAASPQLKPKSRPSLPRPESPLRKQQNLLPPSNGRSTPIGRPSLGGQATRNGAPGSRYTSSPAPTKFGQGAKGRRDSTTAADHTRKIGMTPKPARRTSTVEGPIDSRSSSRFGGRDEFDEDGDDTPIGIAKTRAGGLGSKGARANRKSGHSGDEVERLKEQLEDRDKQLKEQAMSLADMEHSFAELQSLLPTNGAESASRGRRVSGSDDADASQLRALLREKNEKISMLTAEFDAHRADFRSTIDTLELASSETERVYEKRVEDLVQEVRELQDRGEDVESVALQLKQLEELVQELEEGLEDARRGEAEARGEVEFLRGEVERGRSELKREREKAAATLRGGGALNETGPGFVGSKEVEQRDDEIRGLKAIIHSLSRDAVPDLGSPNMGSRRSSNQRNSGFTRINGQSHEELTGERMARETLEREVKELESLLERKSSREEELEREVENLRKSAPTSQHTSAATLNNGTHPERMGTHSKHSPTRDSKDTLANWRDSSNDTHRKGGPLETMHEGDNNSSDADGSALWCEICETGGHDILTCTNMFGSQAAADQKGSKSSPAGSSGKRTGRDVVMEGLRGLSVSSPHDDHIVSPLSPAKKSPAVTPAATAPSMPDPMETGMIAGKSTGRVDANKWCALCERDGHESVDCPFEDVY